MIAEAVRVRAAQVNSQFVSRQEGAECRRPSTPPRTQAVLRVGQEGEYDGNSEALIQEDGKQVRTVLQTLDVQASLTLQGSRATQVLADAPSVDPEALR